MDIQTNLLALREYARCREITHLFNGEDAEFNSKMDTYILQVLNDYHSQKPLEIPVHLVRYTTEIREQLNDSGIDDSEIRAYLSRFGEYSDTTVLSVLALVFELDIGLSWAPGSVLVKCEGLEFDNDGLLVCPQSPVDFTGPHKFVPGKGKEPVDFAWHCEKKGIAYKDLYVIPFHRNLERYNLGLSDGFLRSLSNFVAIHPDASIRIRISCDTLVEASAFEMAITLAQIRGPIGVSPTKLQSNSFPKNPYGDVTEHLWVEDESGEIPLAQRLFPVDRFQVKWSRDGHVKVCEAEELVLPHNSTAKDDAIIFNRYVHARWDTTKGVFCHFDGSIRGYSHQKYPSRLSSDIKQSKDLSDCYVKLWRLDGEIPFESWADLMARYFQGNNLATEYLESEL